MELGFPYRIHGAHLKTDTYLAIRPVALLFAVCTYCQMKCKPIRGKLYFFADFWRISLCATGISPNNNNHLTPQIYTNMPKKLYL